MRRRSVSEAAEAGPVLLKLRDPDEVQLLRALLGLHVRRSMNRPGMESASAVLARRLLRRLDG